MPLPKYDVFISHASEDKAEVVFPLADLLKSIGVKVWYDQFELDLGDSLSRSIDRGLANSKFGIVVISPAFLSKNWPEYELRGLVSQELNGDKVILPIWHNVTREDVLKYSPTLADKLAIVAKDLTPTTIVRSLVKVIRPDILEKYTRAILAKAAELETIQLVPLNKIHSSPPRHSSLPDHQMARIITLHAITEDVFPMSLAETIYSFRCDLTPESEIRVWERIASSYYLATHGMKFPKKKRKDIFNLYLYASMAPLEKKDYHRFKTLKADEIEGLLTLYDTSLAHLEFQQA